MDLSMNTVAINRKALSLPMPRRAEVATLRLFSLDALSESEIEPLLSVNTAHQVFLTSSSIGLWIQTSKFWSSPPIVGSQAIGLAGLNWLPKTGAYGCAWL